jgi:hypothetical protein
LISREARNVLDQDVFGPVGICTLWGSLIVDARTQMWFPWKVRNRWAEGGRSNYSDHIWSPIVWHPKSE